jgi:hypothetical protein
MTMTHPTHAINDGRAALAQPHTTDRDGNAWIIGAWMSTAALKRLLSLEVIEADDHLMFRVTELGEVVRGEINRPPLTGPAARCPHVNIPADCTTCNPIFVE